MAFIARLAALVAPPRANLVRYHGVFAANAPLRPHVVAAPAHRKRTRGQQQPATRSRYLSWQQLMARVFAEDVMTCRRCGGAMRFHGTIESPTVIEAVLAAIDISNQQHARPPP